MKSPNLIGRFLRTGVLVFAFALLAACAIPAELSSLTSTLPEYEPSPEIVQLASEATMTTKARDLFFGARPEIDTDRSVFEEHCQAPVSTTSVELGCYTSDNRIYLLRLSDPQLSQMMIVTAAHEMLHAAYSHLGASDRAALDAALESQVVRIRDRNLAQELSQYRVFEPGQRDNELHSIIGAEYAPLDPRLEQYYHQYFDNRQVLVANAQKSSQLFAHLQRTLDNLQAQIDNLRTQMSLYRRRGNLRAYNALVPQFNALIREYNQTVLQYNSLSRSLVGQESPASPE